MDEETIYRGRRTERGDAVFLNLAQDFVGSKLLMVEYEHGSSGKPLSVHLSPYGLAPTCVCHGEVDAVFAEVVPIDTSGEMSHGIEEVVSHHLRFATRSTGEVHQHCVVVVVLIRRTHEGGSIVPLLVPVVETIGLLGTDAHKNLERGAIGLRACHLLHYIILAGADDGFHAGAVVAIYYVVGGEHVGCGNCNGTDLVQCKHRQPELIATLEYQHHHVALAYAQLLEISCGTVALLLDILE